VFTARYGLIPYIKQVTFRRHKVNQDELMRWTYLNRTQFFSNIECVTDLWSFGNPWKLTTPKLVTAV
jgi:hypothetical protein